LTIFCEADLLLYQLQETLLDGYPSIANLKKKLNRLLGMVECEGNDVSDFPRNPL
jgi:hypothetical protein